MKQASLMISIMLIMVFMLSACSFGIETTQVPQSLPTSMVAAVEQPTQPAPIPSGNTYTVDCPNIARFEVTTEVAPINWYCNSSSAGYYSFILPNGVSAYVELTIQTSNFVVNTGHTKECTGSVDYFNCSVYADTYVLKFSGKITGFQAQLPIAVSEPISTAAPQSNLIVAESPTPTSNVVTIMPEGTAPPGHYIKCGWGNDANIVTCVYVTPDWISYHYADKKMAVYGPKLTEEGDLIAVGPIEITCYIEEGERYSLMLIEDSTGTQHYVSNDSQSCSGFLEP